MRNRHPPSFSVIAAMIAHTPDQRQFTGPSFRGGTTKYPRRADVIRRCAEVNDKGGREQIRAFITRFIALVNKNIGKGRGSIADIRLTAELHQKLTNQAIDCRWLMFSIRFSIVIVDDFPRIN